MSGKLDDSVGWSGYRFGDRDMRPIWVHFSVSDSQEVCPYKKSGVMSERRQNLSEMARKACMVYLTITEDYKTRMER